MVFSYSVDQSISKLDYDGIFEQIIPYENETEQRGGEERGEESGAFFSHPFPVIRPSMKRKSSKIIAARGKDEGKE